MNTYVFAIAVMGLLMLNTAHAAEIETLFMPGDVIEGHAKFESECSKCHVRFQKRTQSRLCRDCHEDIDADVEGQTGFHGRNPAVSSQTCTGCHTDHIGRNGDIALLDRATFDHALTDFELEGAHTGVSCAVCHEPEKKFSEAPGACYDCHRKQDPHAGNLGEDCADCHSAKGWKKAQFDHEKTDFPLRGKHEKVLCSSCHLDTHYDKTPTDCNSCHYLNDVHNGRNGSKCADCHNAQQWDKTDFDHDRQTEFRLNGAHRSAACESCHTPALGKAKPKADCYSCHRNDDQHKGRYGKKCQSCHNETRWNQARFDHAKNTDFALRGRHADLACAACHRGELQSESLSAQCYGCHRADDVHRGQEGEQCQRCHQESSWSERIVFDHGLTRFPLLGLHASTPCEECHLSAAFQDTAIDCYACHEGDDDHKTALGTGCAQCHNPNGWGVWIFDHNEQTDFRLDGAHAELGCANCHNTPAGSTGIRQSSSCQSCHEQDDEHRGRFGRNCERCHNTKSFADVTIQ
ncbi:MAG: hypothetical protein J5I92_11270 [Thiogranum sp.]|nr:hypothetical protein [Thiogranum sp.]